MSLHHALLPLRPAVQCLVSTTRPALARCPHDLISLNRHQTRSSSRESAVERNAKAKLQRQKNKKKSLTNSVADLKKIRQFSLLDAMRYIRAAEVGQSPTTAKYELHVKLKTLKDGPVLRNRIQLPHPVSTDRRMAVIVKPGTPQAAAATKAGAVLVGEDNIFEAVRQGQIDFDRCICHQDSLPALNKAQVARILGPKGLMPSVKTATVVRDVGTSVRDIVSAAQYRERGGIVQMAIGQLAYTPEQLQTNISAFISALKQDCARMSEKIAKSVHEVVLSSTHGPGLSLTGQFRDKDSVPAKDLAT